MSMYEIKATRVIDGQTAIPLVAIVEAASGVQAIDRLAALSGGSNFSIISVSPSGIDNEYILVG